MSSAPVTVKGLDERGVATVALNRPESATPTTTT